MFSSQMTKLPVYNAQENALLSVLERLFVYDYMPKSKDYSRGSSAQFSVR